MLRDVVAIAIATSRVSALSMCFLHNSKSKYVLLLSSAITVPLLLLRDVRLKIGFSWQLQSSLPLLSRNVQTNVGEEHLNNVLSDEQIKERINLSQVLSE